jgi:hypothetical protein
MDRVPGEFVDSTIQPAKKSPASIDAGFLSAKEGSASVNDHAGLHQ